MPNAKIGDEMYFAYSDGVRRGTVEDVIPASEHCVELVRFRLPNQRQVIRETSECVLVDTPVAEPAPDKFAQADALLAFLEWAENHGMALCGSDVDGLTETGMPNSYHVRHYLDIPRAEWDARERGKKEGAGHGTD